ncbi:hypothetical protein AB833_31205, partial [Chromatiales bacterium (ex Bugula neritina AB1)]
MHCIKDDVARNWMFSAVLCPFIFILLILFLVQPSSAAVFVKETFNDPGSLTSLFNPDSSPVFTENANSGINGTGSISVPSSSQDLWTTKAGYSVSGVGDVYVLSAYFKIRFNNGFGGLGLAASDTNESVSPGHAPVGIGATFHGGGGAFHSNYSTTNLSWFSSSGDLVLGNWYKFVLTLRAVATNTYDLEMQIINSDAAGNLGSVFTTQTLNGVVNSQIGSAEKIHVYFSSAGSRMELIDDFTMQLGGGAALVPDPSTDTDSDGIPDLTDADDDNDGTNDDSDFFPLDASETTDTDGDTIGNNADTDDDNDGVDDVSDLFPLDSAESSDADGDGVGDNGDAFPNDATESEDTDNDGIGNNIDTDDDNDGVPDIDDVFPLDPTRSDYLAEDIVIDATLAAAIESALATGDVIIDIDGVSTVSDTAARTPGDGTIYLQSPIAWDADTQLTLRGSKDIILLANISASGDNAGLQFFHGSSDVSVAATADTDLILDHNSSARVTLTGQNPRLLIGRHVYDVFNSFDSVQELRDIPMTAGTYVALGESRRLLSPYFEAFYPDTYSGTFNGLGNHVDGLMIQDVDAGNYGFFSSLSGADVRNLGIINVAIQTNADSRTDDKVFAGALAGLVKGSSSSDITHLEGNWSSGYLSTKTGSEQVAFFGGGLVGHQNSGTLNLRRSYSTANVSAQGAYSDALAIGGLLGNTGIQEDGAAPHIRDSSGIVTTTVTQSYATGTVVSGSAYHGGYYGTGGLIGVIFSNAATITDSYAIGTAVSDDISFGGLVGFGTGGASFSRLYTTQQEDGNFSGTNIYTANSFPSATSSGTVLPAGFDSSVWSVDDLPQLKSLAPPPVVIYVRETLTSGAEGSPQLEFELLDATGNVVSVSDLTNIDSIAGTAQYTLDDQTPVGTYNVSYVGGLHFEGDGAENYTLAPYSATAYVITAQTALTYTLADVNIIPPASYPALPAPVFSGGTPTGAVATRVLDASNIDVTSAYQSESLSTGTYTLKATLTGDSTFVLSGSGNAPGELNIDADTDGDGTLDSADDFPSDPTETLDTDEDGTGNNADTDDDNDGVDDTVDAFPLVFTETTDSDGDGVGDNADIDDDNDDVNDNLDAFPYDSSETKDTDGDGVGDNSDAFPADGSETHDSDMDGIGDNADADDDNDGVNDVADAFPLDPTESSDSDGDGTGDNADAFPNDATEDTDTDSDGTGDNADSFPNDASEQFDTDNDGTGDNADAFPNDASEDTDTDNDGIGNNTDTDDDNDGVDDTTDVFPFDATETTDTDGDGVGDNSDAFPNDASEQADSDNDGTGDNADAFPNDASEDTDTDSDGIGNNADTDDDNDGVDDTADAFPLDATETTDTDADGVGDNSDAFPNDASEQTDSDNDGTGDNADAFPNDASEDTDTDSDGIGN